MLLAKLQSTAGGREREGCGSGRKGDKIVNYQIYGSTLRNVTKAPDKNIQYIHKK